MSDDALADEISRGASIAVLMDHVSTSGLELAILTLLRASNEREQIARTYIEKGSPGEVSLDEDAHQLNAVARILRTEVRDRLVRERRAKSDAPNDTTGVQQ